MQRRTGQYVTVLQIRNIGVAATIFGYCAERLNLLEDARRIASRAIDGDRTNRSGIRECE